MRTRISTLLIGAVLLAIGAAPASAQNSSIDSRWIAYLGCWRSLGAKPGTVCFVPTADTAAIDLVTIVNGEVTKAEQIIAGGKRVETARGECTGWQSADWSGVADRLYLHSEETCPGWGTRTGSGLIAMTRDGQILYIQASTLRAKTGVEVQRYRQAGDVTLPSEVQDALDALHLDMMATTEANASARAPLAVDDLVEASRQLDADAVEAWLIERGSSFVLDAKRLTTIAEAGVPSRITDLMIALSYPDAFVVDARSHNSMRRGSTPTEYLGQISPTYGSCLGYDWSQYDPYYCDGFANGFLYDPYGYGYGYDYYPRDYPVVIIFTGNGDIGGGGGGGTSSRSHGQVVNGRGYREGPGASSEPTRWAEPRSPSGGSTSGAAAASPSPSSGSSSSSGGEQRTAKPRP